MIKCIPNLGLVINLSNRNHDPGHAFEQQNIKYKKIMTPGHEIPTDYSINKFKFYVKEFFNNPNNNNKLIGVHCTHGVNRTGYFICNFMISELGICPAEAIQKFEESRGHKIRRLNYIDALNKTVFNI